VRSNYRVRSRLFFFSYGDDGASGRQKKEKTLKRRSTLNEKLNIKWLHW